MFADGASSGNPGPGGWGTVIVLPEGKVIELGGGVRPVTNNQMELRAVIEGLRYLQDREGQIDVCTDSVYVIRGITQWVWAWRTRGWKTAEGQDVANADLWKELFRLVAQRGKENSINWKFVRGHQGIPGNERVDKIAVSYAKGKRPDLYEGPLLQYPIAIHDIPDDTSLPDMKPKAAPKAAAHSYLSVIHGVPMRHSSWKDCEARIKGQSGAKFKKAMSPDDEDQILRSWGYSLADIRGS